MAIQDSFNLSQATSSQSYAYKCWYNYNYGGNTMNISSKDMSEITATWSGQLKNWKATATKDENKYEITDDNFNSAKENGKETAKDKTDGFDGKKSNAVPATTLGAGVAATGCATAATFASGGASVAAGGGGMVFGIVGAGIVIANAIKYYAGGKPNKDAKEACDALQDEMVNAQMAIAENQENMAEMDEELIALSDEAQLYNEDANEDVEEKKSEFDLYRASYDALKAKVEAGEPLSEDEKALYKELALLMQELGVGIEETSEETTDVVSEIYDEMGTYQDGFDTAAETIGEVEGLTDYAEGFDEATRRGCYVEAAGQTSNAAAGAIVGAKLIASATPLSFWRYILGGAAIAAGVTSGIAAKEQFNWAGQVGKEIEERKAVQDLNAEASDVYDERIDNYAGYTETVEELELEIPDDMDAPETGVTETSGGETTAAPAESSFGISPKEDNKDKEEK